METMCKAQALFLMLSSPIFAFGPYWMAAVVCIFGASAMLGFAWLFSQERA